MKSNIFKLYQREKVIKFTDDDGNEESILLVKPSQTEADAIQEYYQKQIEEYTNKLDKDVSSVIEKKLKEVKKSDLIDSIISIERVKVIADKDLSVDIFNPDDSKKSDKEIKKGEDDAVKLWENDRKEVLGKMKPDFLRKIFCNYTVSSMAIANSMSDWDKVSLCYVCHPVDKRDEYIFSINKDDENFVGNASPELLQKLKEELKEFLLVKGQREIRELAESSDFIQTTEQEKP